MLLEERVELGQFLVRHVLALAGQFQGSGRVPGGVGAVQGGVDLVVEVRVVAAEVLVQRVARLFVRLRGFAEDALQLGDDGVDVGVLLTDEALVVGVMVTHGVVRQVVARGDFTLGTDVQALLLGLHVGAVTQLGLIE